MSASKVRVDYDALQEIANIFDQHSSNSRRVTQQLQRRMETLQNGDWIGTGATAFYQEMNSDVLPAMRRLAAALETANRIIRQSSQIMREAEDEASRVFNIQPTPFVIGTFGNLGNTVNESDGGSSSSGNASGGNTSPTSSGANSGIGASGSAGASGGAGASESAGTSGGTGASGSASMSGGADASGNADLMEELAKEIANDPNGPGVDRILQRIAELRGRSFTDIKSEYKRFLLVRTQAESTARANGLTPPSLSKLLQDNFTKSIQ